MWYDTRVSKILGIQYPILQGPFGGGLSTVKLTATVSNLGGAGGFGAYTLTPEEIRQVNTGIRAATDKPYNINLWISDNDVPSGQATAEEFNRAKQLFQPYFDELGVEFPTTPPTFSSRFENQVDMLLDLRPPAISFMFGIPSGTILEQCRKTGIVTMGAATTLDEAIALEAAGVDLIIASGFEAGGHRPSFLDTSENSLTGTFVLVQLIREKVRTPVIAAGGIATGKGVAAALTLGAEAVQVGTAFLACEESGAPEFYREQLFSDASRYTALTRAFTGRLGRGLRSRISRETRGKEDSILPFPLQTRLMSPLRQAAIARGRWELILIWGGQITPILKHKRAADLMHSLVEDTTAYFPQSAAADFL